MLTAQSAYTVPSLLFRRLQATRAANTYPTRDGEYEYYAAFDDFRQRTGAQTDRLAALLQRLLGSVVAEPMDADQTAGLRDMVGEGEDFGTYEAVADAVDSMLEAAAFALEDAAGDRSNKATAVAEGSLRGRRAGGAGEALAVDISNRGRRPQDSFEDPVDNSRRVFVPKISEKPNAIEPLPDYATLAAEAEARYAASLERHEDIPVPTLPHPYETEISSLVYADWMTSPREEAPFSALDETPVTWVDTPEGLDQLVAALDNDSVREIAVDLENHSLHSFQGFVCLMQVSTRDADWLVDTLALRSRMHVLNHVFTNPNVVKVFHGCDHDVKWLQRDFGLYLVNVFDTGQASRVLHYERFSLAFLLNKFCGVEANKSYQLADWRIRPLTREMMKYAREDTHYLLGIYDRMVNELHERGAQERVNLVDSVLARSKERSLFLYSVSPEWSPSAHEILMHRLGFDKIASPARIRAFAALFEWRDRVAREVDESTGVVLPQLALKKLATEMPTNTDALMRACHPIPPYVRTRAHEVVEILVRAAAETSGPAAAATPRGAEPASGRAGEQSTGDVGHSLSFSPYSPAVVDGRASPFGAGTPSPVLTQDALYSAAGWQPMAAPSLSDQRRAKFGKEGDESRRLPLGGDDGNDADGAVLVPPTPMDDEMTGGVPATRHEREAAVAKAHEELRRDFGHYTAVDHWVASQRETTEAEAVEQAVKDVVMSGVQADDEAADEEEQVDEPTIPKSMVEIYQISNRNRKRSKDKKKSEEDGEEGGQGKRPRAGSRGSVSKGPARPASHTDTVEFMRGVGWIEPGEPDPKPISLGDDHGGSGSATSGGAGGAEAGQFAYTEAVAAAAGARGSAESRGSSGGSRRGSGGRNRRSSRGKGKGNRGNSGNSGSGGAGAYNPYLISAPSGASGGSRSGAGGSTSSSFRASSGGGRRR